MSHAPTIDEAFRAVVTDSPAGSLELIEAGQRSRPDKDRITVLLDLPHLKKYGHQPTRELTYGCSFPVQIGNRVLCPPTPRYSRWTTGIVTALAGNGYRGTVKFVRKVEGKTG